MLAYYISKNVRQNKVSNIFGNVYVIILNWFLFNTIFSPIETEFQSIDEKLPACYIKSI